ncbi:hypothetical protein PN836_020265 [Ningiella sp. W23]|uniref:DUF7281 domain-containing protein n=1 Tax=Ningiella sp. W23 TaxID=3023715 RepID=UPI003756A76E
MSLYQILYTISQGKPINLGSLHKALPSNINPQDIFGNNEMVAKNRYRVDVIDQSRFNDLLAQSKAPTTRREAASHALQSSHYKACDSAYMLCFPVGAEHTKELGHNYELAQGHDSLITDDEAQAPRQLLSVASVRSKALPMQFTSAKYAVLIENQDCFFDWQLLMRHFGTSVNVSECDIYFAGGKRILNPALAVFLKQYKRLYCAFDYDLDGLKMAKSIISKRYATTQVLIPDRLLELCNLFTFKPSSTAIFVEALKQCDDMNLAELSEVIRSTQHFMEQEALLSVLEPS